ncbi:hypothetical protein [Paraburkholderia diazotrophica]|uniref:hypothetical protein n=1 Tax=Paraburkholderia diazotrophica TaxID=667676 RepID=UPI00317C6EA6
MSATLLVFLLLRWHPQLRGCFSVPLASAIAWLFQRAAGIRNCVVVSACRRHPQLRGCFSVPPASAIAWLFQRAAGIRNCVVVSACRRHPQLRLAAQALPLCGAAPTFLCRRKEK